MNTDQTSPMPPVVPITPALPTESTQIHQAETAPVSPPPVSSDPPSLKKPANKLFLMLGVIIALLILAIIAALALMPTSSPEVASTTPSSVPETVEWKPYSDALVSFELPTNWNASSYSEEIYSVSIQNTDLEEVVSISNWTEQTTPSTTAEELQVSLRELYNSPCSLDENGNELVWNVAIERLANINGKEAISLKGECGDDRANSIFVLDGAGTVVQIGIGIDDLNDLATIDQIVKSFKFTQ